MTGLFQFLTRGNLCAACAVCLFCGVGSARLVADDDLTGAYGFSGIEIYKVDFRSGNLQAGDFNHDGRQDFVIIDNSHSRIDLFQQRPPGEPPATDRPMSVNEITSDGRFEHRKLPVDRQVSAMTVGDFNGDGRHDIAYIGLPDRLSLKLQADEGEFTDADEVRLANVSQSSWALDGGDLNGDGRDDLVVLGESETYVLLQTADGGFDQPIKLLNTSDRLGIAQIADLDGDGLNDLCYLAESGEDRLLCARLQGADHRLGPEIQFDVKRQRSLTIANVDGKPGAELLSIDPLTNRVKVQQLQQAQVKAGELAGKLVQYGFGGSQGSRDRDIALADIDGDGRTDLIATDPSAAQVYVFRQTVDAGLDLGTAYPGLQGASQVRVGITGADRAAEVFTLSTKEKAIGVSRMEDERLTIPQVLPTDGEPVALELADLTGDGVAEVLYVSREKSGRSSTYSLRALTRDDAEGWKTHDLSDDGPLSLELASSPDRLSVADVNADGRPDFFIAQGSERPQVLLVGDDQGHVSVVEPGGGFKLGLVSAGAVYLGTPQHPAVIVAQDNFARSFRLDEQNRWEVLEQFNAPESNARIAGSASLNLDGEDGDEIVLIDTGVKRLRILRQEETGFEAWKEVELGNFPFVSAHVADLNGDAQNDLLLFGGSRFAVLYAGRTDPRLHEIASYETRLEKVYFIDVVAGDVNGDGRTDLIVLDTRSHYVEILNYDEEHGLRHGLHFRVFEEKSFTAEDEGSGVEPREGAVVDVTGDGFGDLLLVVHDRVLLYPQDPPPAQHSE